MERIIGIWIDVGCPDFKAARRNRRMVAEKRNIIGYLFIEAFVKAWPRNKPLPEWITMGKLPTISKTERMNINQYGIYGIGDDGLIKVGENKDYNEGVNE